ncbi:MAG: 2-oxoacid:acceptor oxidoreductase subunit alpha [Hyphomicrobiaceae bacterium]
MNSSTAFALVGSGGAGVITAGEILLEAAGKAGWYGVMSRSVGPQIRGGEAAALLRLSPRPVECKAEQIDFLIAIDWRNADRFADEIRLADDGLIVCDPKSGDIPAVIADMTAAHAEVGLTDLAGGISHGRENMIAVGLAAKLSGIPAATLMQVVETRLADKGANAVAAGRECIEIGMREADPLGEKFRLDAPPIGDNALWSITGNQAVGLGAVRGGVRFAAAYPITPATEVLEWLASALVKVGGTLLQAEDELASINMAIGASFGGRAAITATSGPGLALMSESLGLATAAEVPIVIVDVMRGGPSTGIPTKSEQSDLNIAVYGCHGDAPHVVVAPLSIADCIFTTQWAVHLAEAMQVPAIVLSDQSLGQTRAVIKRPANVSFATQRNVLREVPQEAYCRYALTENGVSPMALPGVAGGQYTADGLTHSVKGTPSANGADHLQQLEKRRDKIETFDYGAHWAAIESTCSDSEPADFTIITWGSLTGAVREAMSSLADTGITTKLVAMRLISPFPEPQFLAAIEGARRTLVVEQTHSGQFYDYLRAKCDLPGEVRQLKRPGPHVIRPSEICEHIRSWKTQ